MKLKKGWKRFWTLNCHHAEGFTLVELIVVIAILAILAGVGTAGYGAYVTSAKKKADQTLVSNIVRAVETGTNSTMFVNDDSFTKGATTYPVGIITLTMDDTNGCQVMASNSEVREKTTACSMAEITVVTGATINIADNKLLSDITYYTNIVFDTVDYCSTHTSLSPMRKIYTDVTKSWGSWHGTGEASYYFLEDFTGIFALKDNTNGHGEGVNITTEELEALPSVSRVEATTSGALYDSITAAFGSTDGLKLQYDGWGKEGNDSHTYATLLGYSDSMIANIKKTADMVTNTLASLGSLTEGYLSDDYADSADMVNSFADFTVSKYPTKESWIPIWNAAANGGDSYNFGFPEGDTYHNDYVYAATKGYNAAFTSYCRANGMGGSEYDAYMTIIEEFSGPPNALASLNLAILPRMVNNAAFDSADTDAEKETAKSDSHSLYAKFIDEDTVNGDAVFDKVAELYSKYLSSGVCEKNGASFYDTLTTINKTGSEAYKSDTDGTANSDAYFDYYSNYLQEMSAFYQILENNEGKGIIIIVTVENGEVKCEVSPSAADLRTQ